MAAVKLMILFWVKPSKIVFPQNYEKHDIGFFGSKARIYNIDFWMSLYQVVLYSTAIPSKFSPCLCRGCWDIRMQYMWNLSYNNRLDLQHYMYVLYSDQYRYLDNIHNIWLQIPVNPIFSPVNPIFSPENAIFSPVNPIFSPENPIFSPENPIFSPENPIFSPENPIFSQINPIFSPIFNKMNRNLFI